MTKWIILAVILALLVGSFVFDIIAAGLELLAGFFRILGNLFDWVEFLRNRFGLAFSNVGIGL